MPSIELRAGVGVPVEDPPPPPPPPLDPRQPTFPDSDPVPPPPGPDLPEPDEIDPPVYRS